MGDDAGRNFRSASVCYLCLPLFFFFFFPLSFLLKVFPGGSRPHEVADALELERRASRQRWDCFRPKDFLLLSFFFLPLCSISSRRSARRSRGETIEDSEE